jgi:hypothetical protein
MNLPPEMLEKLGRENWKSQFGGESISQSDNEQILYEQVSAGSGSSTWPVAEFEEDTSSLKQWGLLVTSLFMGWLFWASRNTANLGSVILLTMWLIVPGILIASADLLRAYFPHLRGRVILGDDHLICDRGLGRKPVRLLYKQICRVGLRPKPRLVIVEYYSVDLLENLQTNRLHNIVLPRTFNEETLQQEIRRRAFAPPPSTWSRRLLTIRDFGIAIGYAFVLPLGLAFVLGRLLHG